jgi:hypothetical protein
MERVAGNERDKSKDDCQKRATGHVASDRELSDSVIVILETSGSIMRTFDRGRERPPEDRDVCAVGPHWR